MKYSISSSSPKVNGRINSVMPTQGLGPAIGLLVAAATLFIISAITMLFAYV